MELSLYTEIHFTSLLCQTFSASPPLALSLPPSLMPAQYFYHWNISLDLLSYNLTHHEAAGVFVTAFASFNNPMM